MKDKYGIWEEPEFWEGLFHTTMVVYGCLIIMNILVRL